MISYEKEYDELRAAPWRFQVIRDGEVVHSEPFNHISEDVESAFRKFQVRMDVLRNHFIDDYQEEHKYDYDPDYGP